MDSGWLLLAEIHGPSMIGQFCNGYVGILLITILTPDEANCKKSINFRIYEQKAVICLGATVVEAEFSSKKKQILVLFGSPRKNGFTAKLLHEFLSPLESAAEIRIIHAYESKIAPCTACDACTRAETCSQRDFDVLDTLIRQADVIVVATPVYSLGLPSPLKAIVDRTQRYFSARFSLGVNPPIEKHKSAVLLVTSGSKNVDGANIISRQLRMIFSVMNTTLDNEVLWSNTDYHDGEETYPAAQEHAHNLALAIKCEL